MHESRLRLCFDPHQPAFECCVGCLFASADGDAAPLLKFSLLIKQYVTHLSGSDFSLSATFFGGGGRDPFNSSPPAPTGAMGRYGFFAGE